MIQSVPPSLIGLPLLLHACCAPCSTTALERLHPHFQVSVYFYNPNIDTAEEYYRRLEQCRILLAQFPQPAVPSLPAPVPLLEAPYNPQEFLDYVRGFETAPEGGARCPRCLELRLRATAKKAKALGIPLFATTLTVSPHKNAPLINALGAAIAAEEGVTYLPTNFKKQDGYKRSIALSAAYHLYRQNYCGCSFAKHR